MGFFGNLFQSKKIKIDGSTIHIDIPATLFYKELALYNATSLISNAIARSEIKCFENGKSVKNNDYFLLNVSPNKNETSSYFWHRVINTMIREGKCLVVDYRDMLFCADSYELKQENAILGNVYSNVTVGNETLSKLFKAEDVYMFELDNIKIKALIDGIYEDYGKMLAIAAKSFNSSNAQKYIFHISSIQAGDKTFNKTFEEVFKNQLKDYIEKDSSVFLEYDGYKLETDKNQLQKSSDDFLKIKKDIFQMYSSTFHIPESMLLGNTNNTKEVVDMFLTFGVDPFADMISETLNKAVGSKKFIEGTYYKVDTGKIKHRDIFDLAPNLEKLISCGLFDIDSVVEELGYTPYNTPWSKQHYITKNFEKIEDSLKSAEGGETE